MLVPNLTKNPSFANLQIDQGDESNKDFFKDSICDRLAFLDDALKESEDVTLSPVVSPRKEALKKVVDGPLRKRKETTSEVASEMHLPSRSNQTSKVTMQDNKQKKAVREDDDDEEDDDHFFKFINENVSKPMQEGFEDVI